MRRAWVGDYDTLPQSLKNIKQASCAYEYNYVVSFFTVSSRGSLFIEKLVPGGTNLGGAPFLP